MASRPRSRIVAIVSVALAGFAVSAPIAAPVAGAGSGAVEARARFGPLGRLAGSCWSGRVPGDRPDVHCFTWEWDGRFLRDRHVVEAPAGEEDYEGETLYAGDPEQGRVGFTYWSSDGAVTRGEAIFEAAGAEEVVFPERYSSDEGVRELRSVWRFTGPDRYETIVEELRDGEWHLLWRSAYERTGAAGEGGSWGSYLAHVAAASASLRLHDTAAAQRWLAAAPAGHRGWEWRLLDSRADQASAVLRGHDGPVLRVAISPDGRWLASAGADGTVRLRGLPGAADERVLEAGGELYSVAFSPDSRLLAATGRDRVVRVWSVAEGTELWSAELPAQNLSAVAFSPGGALLAAGGWRRIEAEDGPPAIGVVFLLDAATGERRAELTAGKVVSSLAWSPDGRTLAAGDLDFGTALFEVAADGGSAGPPRVLMPPEDGTYQAVQAVAFSPDGGRLAVAAKDATVRLWDPAAGTLAASLPEGRDEGHGNGVDGVAFHPAGGLLATASSDQTVRLWDLSGSAPVRVLHGHTGAVHAVAFAPGGDLLATASDDGTVRLWRVPAPGEGVLRHPAAVYGLAFSPDGSRLASAAGGGTFKVWDGATGRELVERQLYSDPATFDAAAVGLAWHPDGERLAIGTNHGDLTLWSAGGERLADLEPLASGRALTVSFSPDGARALAPSGGGKAAVWDLATGRRLIELPAGEAAVQAAAWSRDGALLATAAADGRVRLWHAGGEPAADLAGHRGPARAVAFHPRGHLLASAGDDGVIRLSRLPGGEPAGILEGHRERVWNLAWSPDGERLASASDDGTVRLWHAERGEEILALPVGAQVYAVAWSPDGRRLAAAPLDGTVRVLEAGRSAVSAP